MRASAVVPAILGIAFMIVVAVSVESQEAEPVAEIDGRALRLLNQNTGTAPRAALLGELRSQGRPASPEEARKRGEGEPGPRAAGKPEPAIPAEAARRVDRLLRETPGKADLLRALERTPEGRKALERARREGASIGLRSMPGGEGNPLDWGRRGVPTLTLLSPDFLLAPPVTAAGPGDAADVSFGLNVLNHQRSSPYAKLLFNRVALTGTVVTLKTLYRSCARLEFRPDKEGWYVIGLSGVAWQPVELKMNIGGSLQTWTFNPSGYTVIQAPLLRYFSVPSWTGMAWCVETGDLLFASVTVHSF